MRLGTFAVATAVLVEVVPEVTDAILVEVDEDVRVRVSIPARPSASWAVVRILLTGRCAIGADPLALSSGLRVLARIADTGMRAARHSVSSAVALRGCRCRKHQSEQG